MDTSDVCILSLHICMYWLIELLVFVAQYPRRNLTCRQLIQSLFPSDRWGNFLERLWKSALQQLIESMDKRFLFDLSSFEWQFCVCSYICVKCSSVFIPVSSRNETASFGFLYKTSWKNTATSSSPHKCASTSAGTAQIFK